MERVQRAHLSHRDQLKAELGGLDAVEESPRNRSDGNLAKSIGGLDDCRDYGRSSRNWNQNRAKIEIGDAGTSNPVDPAPAVSLIFFYGAIR
jgi:hypothetical protein